jgi:undecaprenyl-diphosphatase
MEATFLQWIHACANPLLDAAFWLSHQLGRFEFCVALVLAAAAWHLGRGERSWALTWVAVGAGVALSQTGLKELVQRPRPELWPRLISEGSFSFPSGHAMASAAFYPLLAHDAAAHRPEWRRLAYAVGALLALFVGVGRLYLGVHWPTDVLAGWTLGLALALVAVRLLAGRPLR